MLGRVTLNQRVVHRRLQHDPVEDRRRGRTENHRQVEFPQEGGFEFFEHGDLDWL